MMAETDVRSPGWVPSGLPPSPIDEQKIRAAAFEDIEPSHGPTVVQTSPLAARLRQEADEIAERREAVAVLEAPRGPVPGKRREWSDEDKARIVAEAGRDGGRVVMARYQLAGSVLNRWIREARTDGHPTPTPIVPKAERSEPAPAPDLTRPAWAAPEAESPEDALGAAIGHLRWHRDHLAAKLAKVDAALAALEELGGEAS